MTRAFWILSILACALALAVACTKQSSTPSAPSGAIAANGEANADGSILKATIPTLQSPINGARIPQGQPVTLLITNSTTPFTTAVALSYRFEVTTAAGAVLESTVVGGGAGTTARTVAAQLDGDATYQWRARPEYQGIAGPWSGRQSFVAPANDGYIRGTELFDPLTNGKTVGTIGGSRNVTFVPGQGIRTNDDLAYVVYELPQTYSSGEMSAEVTGLGPGGAPGKARILSMLDRLGAIASSSKYSFNVQYRGVNGVPENCITWKAVLGDNSQSVEADVDRFQRIIILDPSKVYLWQAIWTPTSFRLVVKEGGTTGPVMYDEENDAAPGTSSWNPEKMYAFIGTNNGAFVLNDGTRVGMTVRNVWVSNRPRPATLP
jgi:hypothetical protein